MRIMTKALIVLTLFAVIGTAAGRYRKSSSASAVEAQDAVYLDRRISMLETRLSSIESSLRMLQQQTSTSQPSYPTPTTRDPETQLLQSEVAILTGRVREVECGLVHLDERTLPASAKESRRQASGQSKDPCRLNPETPVQLSTHR
jgi:hypothetical protein